MKGLKKAILAFSLSIIVAVLLVLGLEAYIRQDTSPYIFNDISKIPPTHTVIVLGASVHSDGKLSPILKDRVDAGIKLFRNGKVKDFLVSGDHRTDDYNEVKAMSNYLMSRGIPPEKITLDHAGFDTYDSMYRAKALFGIDTAIVVTQKFHLPRTLFIAKNMDLHYLGYAAPSIAYQPDNRIKRREKLANFKALWEVLLQKKPTTMRKRLKVTND